MTTLTTFIQKEAQLKALEAELASMKEDNQLQKDIEFKEKLEALMEKHDASKEFVLKILAPEQVENKKTRKPRKLKTYKNPHTGEILKVRGGNQNTLKAWKKEHGGDTVEGWLTNEQEASATEEAKEEKVLNDTPAEAPTTPVDTKETVEKKPANSKAQKSNTVKAVAVTKQKRELPVGMKPAPKGHKPKFQFTPKAKASR